MLHENPIALAIEQAGGQGEVSRALKISPQAVGHWARKRLIPAGRVLDLEKLARQGLKRRGQPGPAVNRFDLRPDLYRTRRKATNGA